MSYNLGHKPAHKGKSTVADPIRSTADIERIKRNLENSSRDLLLFTLGINTAFRISDLLSINVGQIKYAEVGDLLTVKEQKTGKIRRVILNKAVVNAARAHLQGRQALDSEPLFSGQRGRLTSSYVTRLVKTWTSSIGLVGNFSCHTLRKTFGTIHRTAHDTPLEVLVSLYGHSSAKQTLTYLGITPEEIRSAYMKSL